MSLMTREDVLRELELLPVWQLKGQLPTIQDVRILNPVSETSTESALLLRPIIEPAPLANESVEETLIVAPSVSPFRLMISDDASVAFVLDSTIDGDDAQDVETLLSNMLKAIGMRCSIDIPNATLEILSEYAVKSLIVMGEFAANSLLGQQRAIDDWRSDQSLSPIYYQNLPVTVTYHPAFLLKISAYKAKAWLDLCAAKRILQSLSKQ